MSEGVFLSTKQAGATLPPHVNIFPSGLVGHNHSPRNGLATSSITVIGPFHQW